MESFWNSRTNSIQQTFALVFSHLQNILWNILGFDFRKAFFIFPSCLYYFKFFRNHMVYTSADGCSILTCFQYKLVKCCILTQLDNYDFMVDTIYEIPNINPYQCYCIRILTSCILDVCYYAMFITIFSATRCSVFAPFIFILLICWYC